MKNNFVLPTFSSSYSRADSPQCFYRKFGALTNLGEVKRFLESQKVSYTSRPDGATPLVAAAQGGHTEVVRYLLSKENPQRQAVIDSINSCHEEYGTALHCSFVPTYPSCQDIPGLLLQAGADQTVKNTEGQTPIEKAILDGYFTKPKQIAVAWFLLYGAQVTPGKMCERLVSHKGELATAIGEIADKSSRDFNPDFEPDPDIWERAVALIKQCGVPTRNTPSNLLEGVMYQPRGVFSPSISNPRSAVYKLDRLCERLKGKLLAFKANRERLFGPGAELQEIKKTGAEAKTPTPTGSNG